MDGMVLDSPADQTLDRNTPFRVTDLKQWVYCPRVLYYYTCLPDVRPITYKMTAGIEAGEREERLEIRRLARQSLRIYGLESGRCEFNLALGSSRLGLQGIVDMVIWTGKAGDEIPIPVDYKLSNVAGDHFKLQLAAYGRLLEEMDGRPVTRGFLYFIPRRQAEEVRFDQRTRTRLLETLDAMHRMLANEQMPAPTPRRGRCVACEFRRFCNDVV